MEQQKVLWIVFSVALFILVVVGVGVIWFLPNGHEGVKTAAAQTSTDAKINFDPYEWAKTGNNNYPGLEGPEPQGTDNKNFTIIYGQNGEQPQAATGQQPETSSGTQATSQVASPAQTTVARVPRESSPSARAPRVERTLTRTVKVAEHWIQAASFSSSFEAEQAKKLLDSKGISSLVTSHDVNGTTFFRVRIGPYLNQAEAERFLSEIKRIGGFQGSFIVLEYTSRSAQ